MDGITNSIDMNFSKLWEIVKERVHGGHKESDMTQGLNNNTD